jgi:hypothetical protein
MTRPFAAFVLAAALIGAAGCGSATRRPVVKGSVTYRGMPASFQTLTLHPADVRQTFMRRLYLNEEGRFEGDAPEPGEYRVVIELPMAALEGNARVKGADLKLPAKYRKLETTDLRWTIAPGMNVRDIALSD